MASYAPVIRDHLWSLFSVIMAVQAGEPLHTHTVNHAVRMAVGTRLLVRYKLVQITKVALSAAEVLHKNMSCMAIGVAQAPGSLGNIGNMTYPAGIPWRDPAMLLLYRLVTLYNKRNQHLVLFKKCHGVAYLARVIPVFAFLPGLECLLHEMTGRTKIRIIPGISIIPICENATGNRDQKEQDNNGLLVFFDKTDKPDSFIRQALPSLPAQKSKEFVQEKGKNISHEGAECSKNTENNHKDQSYNNAL